MQRYDVAVVGAGFAGLACAHAAASRGASVVVLDRKPEPGATPHTTGLLVKEVADAFDPPSSLTRRIAGIRLYSPSLEHVDLASPGYFFLATDTAPLMRWLAARAASAGADLRFSTPVRGLELHSRRAVLRPAGVATRWVVGADGPRSQVARAAGLGRNAEFLAGLETELVGVRGVDVDRLHCLVDSRLAPGYVAWAVPGLHTTQVGLACRPPHRPDLRAWVDRLRDVFDRPRGRPARRPDPRRREGPPGRARGGRARSTGSGAGPASNT